MSLPLMEKLFLVSLVRQQRHTHKLLSVRSISFLGPCATKYSKLTSQIGCSDRNLVPSNSIFWRSPISQSIIINRQLNRNLAAQKRRTLNVSINELEDKFNMEWPKITLFGDSITRRSNDPDNGCWGSLIDHRVGAYFDVDVRGFEGYNSRWALDLVPRLFPKSYLDKVEIFVLWFGHNDSWHPSVPMHVPVDEYEVNMRSIIKYLRDNGLDKSKIIMITPTWYHQESFNRWLTSMGMPSVSKELEAAQKYSNTVLDIAKSESIDVIDFFDVSLKHSPLETMFCDGVHFSQQGAKILFDHLMPVIEKKIETKYKKSLLDLWHVIPFEQRPEVKPMLGAQVEKIKKENQ